MVVSFKQKETVYLLRALSETTKVITNNDLSALPVVVACVVVVGAVVDTGDDNGAERNNRWFL